MGDPTVSVPTRTLVWRAETAGSDICSGRGGLARGWPRSNYLPALHRRFWIWRIRQR